MEKPVLLAFFVVLLILVVAVYAWRRRAAAANFVPKLEGYCNGGGLGENSGPEANMSSGRSYTEGYRPACGEPWRGGQRRRCGGLTTGPMPSIDAPRCMGDLGCGLLNGGVPP